MKIHSSAKRFLLAAAISTTLTSIGTAATAYTWDNIESSIDGVTYFTDSNLHDPWGLAPGEDAKTIWVANQLTGTVTRYNLDGSHYQVNLGTAKNPDLQNEVVTIPSVPIVQTLTTTSGSPTILDTATASLAVGDGVSGAGIPAGTVISSIDSGVSITLSANATATGASSITFTPKGSPTGIVFNHAAFLPATSKAGAPNSSQEFLLPLASQSLDVVADTDEVSDPNTGPLVVGALVSGGGIPTGTTIVKINHNNGFTMSAKATTPTSTPETVTFQVPSQWLSVTEDGLVLGFNINTTANDATPEATVGYPLSGASPAAGTSYTGCTLAFTGLTGVQAHQLFAADFGTGNIDVYNSDFSPGTSFADTSLPATPTGIPTTVVPSGDVLAWKPYNVKRYATADSKALPAGTKVARVLLVDYVLVDTTAGNSVVSGEGFGFVDVFSVGGKFITRLVDPAAAYSATPTTAEIDAPWGLAIYHGAHQADDAVIVANQGNGVPLNYSLAGLFAATVPPNLNVPAQEVLLREDGNPLRFAELHALHFGVKAESLAAYAADEDELDNGDSTLYFDADLYDEARGLVGHIFKK